MQLLLFFTGSSMGYFGSIFFAGPETGQAGLFGPTILSLGSWQIHLHHWLISFFLLLFLIFFARRKWRLPSFVFSFTFGVLSGLIIQGITYYEDWHQIINKIIT